MASFAPFIPHKTQSSSMASGWGNAGPSGASPSSPEQQRPAADYGAWGAPAGAAPPQAERNRHSRGGGGWVGGPQQQQGPQGGWGAGSGGERERRSGGMSWGGHGRGLPRSDNGNGYAGGRVEYGQPRGARQDGDGGWGPRVGGGGEEQYRGGPGGPPPGRSGFGGPRDGPPHMHDGPSGSRSGGGGWGNNDKNGPQEPYGARQSFAGPRMPVGGAQGGGWGGGGMTGGNSWGNAQQGGFGRPPHRERVGGGFGGARRGGGDGYGSMGGRGHSSGPPGRDPGPFMAALPSLDFTRIELPAFEKEEVDEWRALKKITVVGEAPRPAHNWVECQLIDCVADYVQEKRFPEPTPIQSQALPMACSGRDLIAISETGSGKTLAFAAPMIAHIAAQPPATAQTGPIALIMSPTRELATQILRECTEVGKAAGIKMAAVYGGARKWDQLEAIRQGVDVLVATPGRLIEFLSTGDVKLQRVTYLVLDEADRMIHEGFEEELRQIFSVVRPDRQVLMFSATWPIEVRNLAKDYVKDAARVTVGNDEVTANRAIKQEVIICNSGLRDKKERLIELLNAEAEVQGKLLIFCSTKRAAQGLCDWLRAKETGAFEAVSIHGDKRQEERDWALSEFRQGTHPILVAKVVAQRGLDIPSVTLVLNFDAPGGIADYVHRIGRTARAGATGRAVTFLSGSRDLTIGQGILQVFGRDDQVVSNEFKAFLDGGRGSRFAPPLASTAALDFGAPPSGWAAQAAAAPGMSGWGGSPSTSGFAPAPVASTSTSGWSGTPATEASVNTSGGGSGGWGAAPSSSQDAALTGAGEGWGASSEPERPHTPRAATHRDEGREEPLFGGGWSTSTPAPTPASSNDADVSAELASTAAAAEEDDAQLASAVSQIDIAKEDKAMDEEQWLERLIGGTSAADIKGKGVDRSGGT